MRAAISASLLLIPTDLLGQFELDVQQAVVEMARCRKSCPARAAPAGLLAVGGAMPASNLARLFSQSRARPRFLSISAFCAAAARQLATDIAAMSAGKR